MIQKIKYLKLNYIFSLFITACSPESVEIPRTKSASPVVFYASQSGEQALDQGEGGGNPFASALIELIDRPSLTYNEFYNQMFTLTREKSHGFQSPEIPPASRGSNIWNLKPIPASSKRTALVFVYSDYRKVGIASLPGAKHDLERVSNALVKAGFEVQTALDPTKKELVEALEKISKNSEGTDVAVLYMTGHGFEHNGIVYLMPNDYPFEKEENRLSELAIDVKSLSNYLRAKDGNLIFFGGCRTYW